MFTSKRFALLGFFVAFLSLTPISISPALAAASARSVSPSATSFSTGTFIAFATASKTFTNPLAALSLSGVSAGVAKPFYIENGGTINQNAITMTISLTASAAITNVRNCPVGVLFATPTSCVGGVTLTTNNPTAGVAKVYTMSIPANTWYEFELTASKNCTATISVSVASTQIATFTQNS
jgi:hypothetical protein